MTAQIALLNKEAIALASDSAVTMAGGAGQKIFTSANKLFSLSKYHPVGIMIYGSAIFMGVPWETIIKVYRKKLSKTKFSTLEEYAYDFIKFLDNINPLFPDSIQQKHLSNSIYGYFSLINDAIKKEVHQLIDEKDEITEQEIKNIISNIIKIHHETWEKAKPIQSIPKQFEKNLIEKHGKIIDKAMKEIFEKLPLSKHHSNQLKKIAVNIFLKYPEDIQRENISGIIIAGFGEKDTFPSLKSYTLEGIVLNKLKYKEDAIQQINFELDASIISFAQREMVATFMEGIDPFYKDFEESYLSELFSKYAEIVIESIKRHTDEEKMRLRDKLVTISDEILKDYSQKLEHHRKEKYIDPVLDVVSMLPKDELAAMAESLVNLTSFKRKVTMESETVGGPIDVAVISKGDGFVWIKRKHYFKAELNPQFFANYYREEV